MNQSYHDAPTTLMSYRKRHRPPVLRVTDLGAQRATPHYCRIQVQR